ncbi:uncharacterized protein LOC126745518 [Anthonomus grandis grandis]|uniref:uncharacterized protein LOC126745518 n=1 Tax=Anthonomus grandis grandis TaxID=2921223 RepID=UPI00216532FE|nr:uncharacterized protein LOC126745518 [Anthonomus grandis grandis]
MKMRFVLVCFMFFCISDFEALIIPDELPSILSVIYSNIPTLKKGTDSRIGWGFRLGDRADFQVLLELGPQQYTQPLANQGNEGGANKRNTLNTLADNLYAKMQQAKKQEEHKVEKESSKAVNSSPQWLQNWSKKVSGNNGSNDETLLLNAKPGIAIGEIDAKSVIPDDQDTTEEQKSARPVIKKNVKKRGNQSLVSILTQQENETTR